MDQTKVAIVGMGTVGTGVAKLLLEHGDRAARHAGRQLVLESVVVRDGKKPRGVKLPEGVLSTDLSRITRNPEIKVVAHLVGGLEPAREIMLELLASGKDVVTANKALLAEHGAEIFARSICASPLKQPLLAAFQSSPTSANVYRPIRFNRCAAF
jgi:homoserine dehydrogenase